MGGFNHVHIFWKVHLHTSVLVLPTLLQFPSNIIQAGMDRKTDFDQPERRQPTHQHHQIEHVEMGMGTHKICYF